MSANSLETLIKLGTPFVNPFYKAVVGILYLETIIMQDLDKYLADYKLTYQQFNILRILRGQYPKGVKHSLLKDRMLHKQSDVSRLVNRLVKMGLVDKQDDPLNRRRLNIKLSEEGLILINAIEINNDQFKSLTNSLSEAEIEKLNLLFDKMLQTKL